MARAGTNDVLFPTLLVFFVRLRLPVFAVFRSPLFFFCISELPSVFPHTQRIVKKEGETLLFVECLLLWAHSHQNILPGRSLLLLLPQ